MTHVRTASQAAGHQWEAIREMKEVLTHKAFAEIGHSYLHATGWEAGTLDALVFIRRLQPGQETEALFCHDQLARMVESWVKNAGFCHDQFPPLLLHLSNYLMAAGYERKNGEWLPPLGSAT